MQIKVFQINSVCGIKSTGRICTDIAEILNAEGGDSKIAYGRDIVPDKYKKYAVKIGGKFSVYLHAIKARLFDKAGFGSRRATKKLIKQIQKYNPDLIHLHNIHGYYLHVGVLFRFLRKYNKPIVWSLYDCWSYTGHCAHFDFNGCDKWQSGCEKCAFKNEYPKSIISRSKKAYQKKKKLFTGIDNLHIVAPSLWTENMVKNSFMKGYPVHVLPNGIDLNVFSSNIGEFKNKHGLENKFVILGVSSFWNELKGLKVFNRLADEIDKDKFQIVLVGKGEESLFSNNILHIPATNNVSELCEIYTMADLFVNPTLQETQGLTTVEAFACGTPVVVFNSGGAAECVDDKCGIVVEKNDYVSLKKAIIEVAEGQKTFYKEDCLRKAEEYSSEKRNNAIIDFYKEIVRGKYER